MTSNSLIKMYLDLLRKGELPKDPEKINEDQKIQIRAGILKKKWWKEDLTAQEK